MTWNYFTASLKESKQIPVADYLANGNSTNFFKRNVLVAKIFLMDPKLNSEINTVTEVAKELNKQIDRILTPPFKSDARSYELE